MAPKREWLEKDYYAVLGVSSSADDDEVKKAYRKLANANHPDRHPDDPSAEERFKEISEAYGVIGKTEIRKEYDELRRLGASGGLGGRGGPGGQGGFAFEGGSFEDLFRSIFADGGGGPGFRTVRRPAKGQDVRTALHLSFSDALAGVRTRLRVGDAEFTVKVPAGVKDGATVRISGKGGPGRNGGPPGDVLVEVTVEPHPLFTRKGNDFQLEVPISYGEAVLGTKLTVPTPQGAKSTFKVPAGTAPGSTFRVRGQGAPNGSSSGDLLVTVDLVVPKKAGRRIKELLGQLAEHDAVPEERERMFADGSRTT